MVEEKTSSTELKKESFVKKWGPMFVLSLALAIILIDATVLNVSLSAIIKDLNTDIQSIQWVITAYSLTLAALTITGGRLGDLFGRKRMFVLGAIIFAAGSLLASLSSNIPTLILGESIIEGFGAAMMTPATASLLMSKYRGRDRGIAFGLWGGVAAASVAIGPLLGGYLTTNFGWRWSFRINVFVVAILVLGSLWISESKDTKERSSLDWLAVFLSSTGLLGVVFGIIESTTYGWIKAKETFIVFGREFNFGGYSVSAVSILIGVFLLGLFVAWERTAEKRSKTPLVSLKIFKNKQFTSGMLTTGIISLAQAGLIFSIPVFIQAVRGEDAFHTGLALLPMSLAALVTAPLGGFLGSKYLAPKRLIQIGLLANFFGYLVLRYFLNVNATSTSLIPGLILLGVGIGLVMAQINNITLSAVSVEEAGEAAGVNNTSRQIGATLGTAIVGAVLLSAISSNISSGISESKIIPQELKSTINENVSNQTSNVEFGGGAKISTNIPISIKEEVIKISHQSITDANKEALFYTTFVVLLGLVTSHWLPNQKDVELNEDLAVKIKENE